jgi:hypothetical protein
MKARLPVGSASRLALSLGRIGPKIASLSATVAPWLAAVVPAAGGPAGLGEQVAKGFLRHRIAVARVRNVGDVAGLLRGLPQVRAGSGCEPKSVFSVWSEITPIAQMLPTNNSGIAAPQAGGRQPSRESPIVAAVAIQTSPIGIRQPIRAAAEV